MSDLISRQAAIDAMEESKRIYVDRRVIIGKMQDIVSNLPSAQPEVLACGEGELIAQPEPLSDAYTKAVWTWLLNYQIKAAELKGRYTPYEVLSWVANDWRKEHE